MGSKKQKTEIDFSKYRTPELIGTISSIISLPGAIKSIFTWALYGLLGLVFLVAAILYFTGNLTFIMTALIELYAIPAGTVGGIAIGCAEFVRRSLGNMQKLVNLVLETIARVTADVSSLATGDKELPPPRDLAHDVYGQVILPTLKEACGAVFGLLGIPIYWFYHLTLNQLVRVAINGVISNKKVEAAAPKVLASTLSTVGSVGKEDGVMVSSLRWTQGKLDTLGGWIKFFVMIPCYVVLAFVFALIVSPLAAVWLLWSWGTGTADPEVVEQAASMIQLVFALG